MKLCYYKILLFSLALNILVSSSYENNKNKSYITPRHTPTITSRGLSECNKETSIYNNDPEMKFVKENFDRQTSQRFEEYEQRMITNRQKCKEQCDKDIKQIIVKDKIENLYAGWSHYVSAVAEKAATNAGVRAGFEGLRDFFLLDKLIPISRIENCINPTNYSKKMTYILFTQEIKNSMCEGAQNSGKAFCSATKQQTQQAFSEAAAKLADDAVSMAKLAETEALDAATPALTTYTNAIIASIIVIVVIALVMLIIYLILRYRRKKK
ncbi:PIR protein, putative [Plasmodium sp.]|nr:PIR protein, putative [Plasmodium sp.]